MARNAGESCGQRALAHALNPRLTTMGYTRCRGAVAVAHYRIFQLDAAGQIISGADFECANDREAFLAAIAARQPGSNAEVWQGARGVGSVGLLPEGLDDGGEFNAPG